MKSNLTIITGASSNHYRCLLNLLWSISEWYPDTKVIVWDLGLTPQEAEYLPTYCTNAQLRKFDYSKYPAWFDVAKEKGRMAFRPIAISQAADEFGGIVLWMDAGNIVLRPLHEIMWAAMKFGYACKYRHGKVGDSLFCDFEDSAQFRDRPMADPCVVAFDTAKPEMFALIKKWEAWMLNKNIVAPDGSNDRNHNPDAVFAVLLGEANKEIRPSHFNIATHKDMWPLTEITRLHGKSAHLKPPTPRPISLPSLQTMAGYRKAIVKVAHAK